MNILMRVCVCVCVCVHTCTIVKTCVLIVSVLLTMDRLIQQTIDYTRERKAFGKSILDNQYVHFRLAEMETEVEALRSLVYRATGKNDVACVQCTILVTLIKVYCPS